MTALARTNPLRPSAACSSNSLPPSAGWRCSSGRRSARGIAPALLFPPDRPHDDRDRLFLAAGRRADHAVHTASALALQSYSGFSRFSAESSIPIVVALGITRELGPVMAGLMLAGRIGAAFGRRDRHHARPPSRSTHWSPSRPARRNTSSSRACWQRR
ncbi:MAG: ABC transporter permease [Alphaproteobacteria bacterium]